VVLSCVILETSQQAISGGEVDPNMESGDVPQTTDTTSNESGAAPAPKKKAGRRKIKIEFIEDKSRRQITFSKRKAGLMKKAYELTTLTGTQALLLVASETGHVYTFATPKLQPFVTLPEGKNLIQACLNAPDAQPPPPPQPQPTMPEHAVYEEEKLKQSYDNPPGLYPDQDQQWPHAVPKPMYE